MKNFVIGRDTDTADIDIREAQESENPQAFSNVVERTLKGLKLLVSVKLSV